MRPWQAEVAAGPYPGGLAGVTWDGSSVIFTAPMQGELLRLRGSQVSVLRRHLQDVYGLASGPNGVVYGAQAGSRRIVALNPDGSAQVIADRLDGRIHNNPYALCVDAEGGIWFTDPVMEVAVPGPQVHPHLPHASVLRIRRLGNHGLRLERMTHDTLFPTAIALSAEGDRLYVSDNPPNPESVRELRSYPVQPNGELGGCLVLHAFGADRRGPHAGVRGLCLTDDGSLVACAGDHSAGPGPMIYVFSPAGRVLETNPLDETPVSCCFGDEGLTTLYVTTTAGLLYRIVRPGLKGAQPAWKRVGHDLEAQC